MSSNVAIVGAGIGGLTLALALQRRRIRVTVYEAAASIEPVGAGIWVPTNAMSVLERLGVAAAIEARGVLLSSIEVHDARSGLLQSVQLEPLASRYGFTTVALKRSDLHEALLQELAPGTVELGRRCVGIEPDERRPKVCFEDGGSEEAALIVGADGLRSKVRELIAPRSKPRYAGQTTWRGIATLAAGLKEPSVCREYWGGAARFGYSAVSEREVYWFAPMLSKAGGRDEPSKLREQLLATYQGFPDPVTQILESTEPERILRTDLYDLRAPKTWWQGRVVLLGDAAHASTPNLGQGGAQAIEDAWLLAKSLVRYVKVEHALSDYEHRRQARTQWIAKRSRQSGRLAHMRNPLLVGLRNLAMRSMPDSVGQRQLAQVNTPS